jgi:hypothetical protein
MKKSRALIWICAALVLLALAAAGYLYYCLRAAQTAQAGVYARYVKMSQSLEKSSVTVTENKKKIGTYSLADLGLLKPAQAALDGQYSALDRMKPADFAKQPAVSQLSWSRQTHANVKKIALSLESYSDAKVFADLDKVQRTAPQSAEAYFEKAAYHIRAEQAGNELDKTAVSTALRESLAGKRVEAGKPGSFSFELTSCDCYLLPQVTVKNAGFDFQAMLAKDAAAVAIPVTLRGKTETVKAADYLSVDDLGALHVREAALDSLIASWNQTYSAQDTPYIFHSYLRGDVPLDFVDCSYALDAAPLRQTLLRQLLALDASPVTASFACTDENGQPFDIQATHVEVDVENQRMTFYKNGQLVVSTDVVTGKADGHDTPHGLYHARNKEANAWLTGPDFRVFVKYWVGIFDAYGLHDASWRTKFGKDYYLYGGSHGCVNTPEDAMKTIYDNIDIGTPILIF